MVPPPNVIHFVALFSYTTSDLMVNLASILLTFLVSEHKYTDSKLHILTIHVEMPIRPHRAMLAGHTRVQGPLEGTYERKLCGQLLLTEGHVIHVLISSCWTLPLRAPGLRVDP